MRQPDIMFNRKSSYALNKKDPNAIVYMDANEAIIRLTREDFASEEEFLKWKSWSDGNYHTEDNQDVVEGKHNALDTALGQYTLSLAKLPRQAADRAELREKITSRKQEIQRLRGIVRSLYENLVQGVLTKDEYFDYKEKYESRIADLAVEMEQLEDGLRTMDAQAEQHRALKQDAAQIKTDRALTGALIERLIDRIEVSHDKQITVRYRFQSEFETYAEVLEQCRNM